MSPSSAEEKEGVMVDVQKTSLERHDGVRHSAGTMSIDRQMALRILVRNNSMRPVPETTLNYVMVIERWNHENSRFQRSEGQLKLATLAPCLSTTLDAGNVHIGGHLHGTSERHMDHIVGWKVSIVLDGKSLDFMSNPNFEALNKRADR